MSYINGTESDFWIEENHLYLGGLLNVLLGIVFLLAAFKCRIPWLVVLFGAVSLVKGVLLFVLGRQKVVSWAEKLAKRPSKTLRSFAIMALIFGFLLIQAA